MQLFCLLNYFADTSVFALENQQAIRAKFAGFQIKVCEKLSTNGVDTKTFRMFVANQFPPGDCIPPSPTSLTEVFEAITQHGLWDYFHYSPLVHIAKTFGAGDPEMEELVQTYQKDLQAHLLVAKVKDYIEDEINIADHPPAKKAKYDLRYYFPMKWKTEFNNHSLKYLTEVWELFSSHYLQPDCPSTALLDCVRGGCVTVTWLVPSGLIPSHIEKMKVDTDFYRQHHILSVTVGNECVYKVKSVSCLYSLRNGMHQNSYCLMHPRSSSWNLYG